MSARARLFLFAMIVSWLAAIGVWTFTGWICALLQPTPTTF